ncbi:hydroxymethylglutaryl-CoA lyase [Mitosporidium daphniae]|uniref:hydroxymethylglutaryl-CoA lyase n=2 Tax=Mitosporidium daphniae TaxID=1485682 RepID=A0A098VPL6_9MICR|nr:hydroxymethylglutaryl-CoA lyase [Mitosporidium daphniae]KGG51002.1 hydroxymethylglutaryl-CoA lyase [Mitosporidium daphniae]|eukprot:XP_013237453.1 hydroxymethylglutaryl-CoA lyase [Mitosporidium daphniae]
MLKSAFVKLVEVGPRDGLQSACKVLQPEQRAILIKLLAHAGLTSIEGGSFVSPKWVPTVHMDDAWRLKRDNEPLLPLNAYSFLVPNKRGLEAALNAGVSNIAVFGSTTESFSMKNLNCSISASMQAFEDIIFEAKTRNPNITIRGYLSCVLGCPYEGLEIDPKRVACLAKQYIDMGCSEVSLGDTIGAGTPQRSEQLIEAVSNQIALPKIAMHFHNTYGQALANIWASLKAGIRIFDCSIAGLGGCPYAKSATGNVATEDVVYMLQGTKYDPGVDLDKLKIASDYILHQLGIFHPPWLIIW